MSPKLWPASDFFAQESTGQLAVAAVPVFDAVLLAALQACHAAPSTAIDKSFAQAFAAARTASGLEGLTGRIGLRSDGSPAALQVEVVRLGDPASRAVVAQAASGAVFACPGCGSLPPRDV